MEPLSYTFRANLLHKAQTFSLEDGRLAISNRTPIAFPEIRQIRTYEAPGMTLIGGAPIAPSSKRCIIRLKTGYPVKLSSSYFVATGSFEDRSAAYDPFVAKLIESVSAANPATAFIAGMPMALWLLWIFIIVMALLLVPLIALAVLGMYIDEKAVSGGLIYAGLLLLSIVVGIRPLIRTLRHDRPRRYNPRASAVAAS